MRRKTPYGAALSTNEAAARARVFARASGVPFVDRDARTESIERDLARDLESIGLRAR